MTKPITPKQAKKEKVLTIPTFVIEAVNQLITENLISNGSVTFKQDDIISRILVLAHTDRNEIFKNGWLDFEDLFREAGWRVEYDKPSYCESYDPYFVFTDNSHNTYSAGCYR